MDLSIWLRRRAAPRPLLVAVPGATAVRWAVERELRERGWTTAATVAEADLLVVCGEEEGELWEAVERVWHSLPSPRVRVDVRNGDEATAALDEGRARLQDRVWQHDDTAARSGSAARGGAGSGEQLDPRSDPAGDHADHPHHDHHGPAEHGTSHGERPTAAAGGNGGDVEGSRTGHEGHGVLSGHDMSGDGHDMNMMHGGEVAGLAMADRAADRDGLTLDQVHLTLGPVLPDWPAGLVARLALQGDVVQSADVEVLEGAAPWADPVVAAPVLALDDLAGLLSVCGWDVAARAARRLRDEHLAGTVKPLELRRFVRRVRRSRTLRWATNGVGLATVDQGGERGAADATHRWLRWLDDIEGRAPAATERRVGSPTVVLPDLLVGQELAAVRIVVASFGTDLRELAPYPVVPASS